MQRKSKHPRILLKYLRRTVALVHVAVDHRYTHQAALAEQPGGSHRNVIENAKS